jgi:heme-degrading monooxygenase HmoA
MFVALSRFIIRNAMAAEVRQAFSERPHLVDKAQGFIGMQVMSPLENSEGRRKQLSHLAQKPCLSRVTRRNPEGTKARVAH